MATKKTIMPIGTFKKFCYDLGINIKTIESFIDINVIGGLFVDFKRKGEFFSMYKEKVSQIKDMEPLKQYQIICNFMQEFSNRPPIKGYATLVDDSVKSMKDCNYCYGAGWVTVLNDEGFGNMLFSMRNSDVWTQSDIDMRFHNLILMPKKDIPCACVSMDNKGLKQYCVDLNSEIWSNYNKYNETGLTTIDDKESWMTTQMKFMFLWYRLEVNNCEEVKTIDRFNPFNAFSFGIDMLGLEEYQHTINNSLPDQK